MSFSSGLRIVDVDDFLAPTQECIKPVKINQTNNKTAKIIIGDNGDYSGVTETGEVYKLQRAEITLNDCLACSGCITTAEEILVKEQSEEEFLKKLKEFKEKNSNCLIVISISPQSLSSLAVRFNLCDTTDSFVKLKQFFKTLSVDAVLDVSFGREFSLIETAKEFCTKFESGIGLPLLTGICPGWVCYGEKCSNNKTLVPLICNAKSPQQVMGYLVKHYLPKKCPKYSPSNCQIFHATIMPCFDKKLEASRDEFTIELPSVATDNTVEKVRDVDIVLSTRELENLIVNSGFDFKTISSADNFEDYSLHEVEKIFSLADTNRLVMYRHSGSGSGGYLDYVLRQFALTQCGITLKADLSLDEHISIKRVNANLQEIALYLEPSPVTVTCNEIIKRTPVAMFAYMYGQGMIQRLEENIMRKKCRYQFVEVMACPGGCVNGGGQIKSNESDSKQQKMFLERVTQTYNSAPVRIPSVCGPVQMVLDDIGEEHKSAFSTSYRTVEKIDILAKSIKW